MCLVEAMAGLDHGDEVDEMMMYPKARSLMLTRVQCQTLMELWCCLEPSWSLESGFWEHLYLRSCRMMFRWEQDTR